MPPGNNSSSSITLNTSTTFKTLSVKTSLPPRGSSTPTTECSSPNRKGHMKSIAQKKKLNLISMKPATVPALPAFINSVSWVVAAPLMPPTYLWMSKPISQSTGAVASIMPKSAKLLDSATQTISSCQFWSFSSTSPEHFTLTSTCIMEMGLNKLFSWQTESCASPSINTEKTSFQALEPFNLSDRARENSTHWTYLWNQAWTTTLTAICTETLWIK